MYSASNRDAFADIVSMASSIISASQVPDPSETGLFDAPPRPRMRNYRYLGGNYTYVAWSREINYPCLSFNSSAFEFGDNTTALYQVGVLLDPLSETAQKWSPLMEVSNRLTQHMELFLMSIQWLRTLPDVFVDLHINPAQYTEVGT